MKVWPPQITDLSAPPPKQLIALRRTFDLRPVGDKLAYDNFVDACCIAGPRLAKALIAALDVVQCAREHHERPTVTGYSRVALVSALAAFDLTTAEKGERR